LSTTRIYERLPSDAGVTFEGFEDIKLKSRESVKEKLEDFIEYCKNARKPAIRVILGEWGEGKTDAYKRYIEPKAKADGNYAFFVSASTLSNGYETPPVVKLLKTTSLSAVRFLVVVFNCIREESRETKIPDPQSYQDASSYLNATLNNLIGEQKTRRIFIFIDEFEELLLTPARLRDIISGVKETINGRYAAIDEGGEYEGCVHFIIAATPDAYYRLQVDEESALIFGGLGRRAGVIDLPQIRKEEGITFIFELLKYIYRNNLPDPLPFNNLGIFNAIFRITQGNPGNIVSLFTRLMNSARVDEKSIKVIDSGHFLRFLEKEYVFVYGGSTACLETETFYRFLKLIEDQKIKDIGKKCSLLLKTIVGELKPFSAEELEKRLNYRNVRNLIAIINGDLKRKEGIEKAILKVSPLRQDKTFRDIEIAFKDFITTERGEKFIKIDNYSERLEAFEDRISFFEYKDNDIIKRIYLPSDRRSIMSFFEGITFDRAVEIEHIINRRLCGDEDYYIASDELLSQIFPTPIPRELDFIRNREKRLKLWRNVTKNLAKEYESYMPAAFIYVLEKSGLVSITEKAGYVPGIPARFAELTVEGMKINTIFFSINGDVKGTDIEELWRLIRGRRPPIHCAFLIFTGELTQEAEDKIENKEMGKEGENIILEIRVHPTLAKRIICMYKASFMIEDVDKNLLSSVISKLVTQELDIPTKIKNWLKEQEGRGIVITDLPIEATSNLREFADTLKFFINFIEYEGTTEEIFNKNQELLGYIRYAAKKVGLIPDIQLPKFNRIVEDLLNNGFLIRSRSKYKIKRHPVENRILKILEKETRISQKELEGFFILKRSRYLSDVFLPVLEYKGLIKKEGNNYLLTDKNELFSEVEDYYRRFKRLTSDKQYQNYGFIYMTKERGERFISLTEFELFVDKLHNQLQEIFELNEEIALQKLSLMKRLLEHFMEELLPLFEKAYHKAEDILNSARTIRNRVRDSIDKLREDCDKWLKLKFRTENVTEYKKVQKSLEEIEKYATLPIESIKEITKEFKEEKKIFSFRNEEETAFYFNPKLYKMSALLKEIEETNEDIRKTIENLEEQFGTFDKRQKEIESTLKDKTIDEKCKVSYTILKILNQLSKNLLPQIQPMTLETVRLDDLLRFVQQNMQPINANLNSFMSCAALLDELHATEEKFVDSLEECQYLCSYALFIFDIEEYVTAAKKFEAMLKDIASEYESCLKEIYLENPQSILRKIKDLRIRIDDLREKLVHGESLINSKWKEYVNATKDFISNIEDILGLLQRLSLDVGKSMNRLNVIRKYIKAKRITELDLKLSELEQMKNKVREILYESLKEVLTNVELQLIEFLVRKLRREKRRWLPVEDIYQFAKAELQIDPSKATELLRKLIKQGILREGISLAF